MNLANKLRIMGLTINKQNTWTENDSVVAITKYHSCSTTSSQLLIKYEAACWKL